MLNPADQVVCMVAHKRAEEKPEEAEEVPVAAEGEAGVPAGEEAPEE